MAEQDKLLMVTVGGTTCAIRVADVEGVLSLPRHAVSAVPFEASGRIRGIFMHKGCVTAIVRREGLLSENDQNGEEELTAVILKDEGRSFALLVDRAEAVTEGQEKKIAVQLDVHKLYTGETNHDN